MKLKARVRLNFKSQKNRLLVVYNTYEKATYDQFLVSSIVLRSKSKVKAYKYIDELTGKGSLNSHFKSMYEEYKDKYSGEDLNKIMTSSLLPVEKHEEYYFTYYPELNVSVLQNKTYIGDLSDMENIHISLVTSGEFQRSKIIQGEVERRSNMYLVEIDDNKVSVNMFGNKIFVDEDLFRENVIQDIDNLEQYKGSIVSDVEGEGWNLLNKAKINDIINSQYSYYEEGTHFMITYKYLKRTTITSVWGIYFYKENLLNYNKSNINQCRRVLEELYDSKRMNEFKVKHLVKILKIVDDELIMTYLNYILDKKDSKELALLGLDLVEKGNEKGWSKEAVKNFKKYATSDKEMSMTYIVDYSLDYSISDLLSVQRFDKTLLIENHKSLIRKYEEDRISKFNYINNITGRIMNSGRRDKVKKKDFNHTVKKEYNKLITNLAHTKRDLEKINDAALSSRYAKAQRLEELDKIVIKIFEEMEGKENE